MAKPASSEFRELTVAGGTVNEDSARSLMIGRTEQVEALWVRLRNSSARLSAKRRFGRTWFLNLALAMRPEWAGPTLFNAASCRNLREFVRELNRHLRGQGYIPDAWEKQVRQWFTQGVEAPIPETPPDQEIGPDEDWASVLNRTCGILMSRGHADCPVLMIDELPVFLETLIGEWAEAEAISLLEALRNLRGRYPSLRMILSDAEGLQRILDKLRLAGYSGHPLDDMPPFELPPLSPEDGRYLDGCLLLGEQVPSSDMRAVAGAVAKACENSPSAIRNAVDWMARFTEEPWAPERVGAIPLTWFVDGEDPSELSHLEDSLSPFDGDDYLQDTSSLRSHGLGLVGAAGGRAESVDGLPFALDRVLDETELAVPASGEGHAGQDDPGAVDRYVVAGPLAEVNPQGHLDPGSRSLEWLDSTLSPPHRNLARQVESALADAMQSQTSRYALLMGPCGSGKSHVLAYVAKRLQKTLGTNGNARCVVFLRDGIRGLDSLFDLLYACQLTMGVDGAELRSRLEGLTPAVRTQKLVSLFREMRANRPTLLAVEDLGTAFQSWNKAATDALRAFLEDEPALSLVGTVTNHTGKTGFAHGWITERLAVHSMPALGARAARQFLGSLAAARGDGALASRLREPESQSRVDVLHALSGGNCRVLTLLDRCLSENALERLEEPVMQVVRGDLAPIYERRMSARAPQQYRMLKALAEQQGRAVNVTELARYMFLTPQAVSRQMQDLLRNGFVLRTQVGREICYELSDPLARFVLEIKKGRETNLTLLVRVLSRWSAVYRLHDVETSGYPSAEAFRFEACAEVEHRSAGNEATPSPFVALGLGPGATPAGEWVSHECVRLRQATLRDGKLQQEIAGLLDGMDGSFAALVDAARLVDEGRNTVALMVLNESVTGGADGVCSGERQAMAAVNKSYALLMMNRYEEAVAVCRAWLNEAPPADETVVRECRAMMMVNQSFALLKLGRCDEASQVCEGLIQWLGNDVQNGFVSLGAAGYQNHAIALERLGRYGEALATLDMLIARFGRCRRSTVRSQVATAWRSKAALQARLGRHEEALASCDAALRIHPAHARALVQRVQLLLRSDADEATLRGVEDVVDATAPGQVERVLLAASLFERMEGKETLVQLAAAVYGRDRTSLLHGLMLWVRRMMPVTAATARRMDGFLHTLRPIFDNDDEADPIMTLADALGRTALGEARAMLDLPVEVRRLLALG